MYAICKQIAMGSVHVGGGIQPLAKCVLALFCVYGNIYGALGLGTAAYNEFTQIHFSTDRVVDLVVGEVEYAHVWFNATIRDELQEGHLVASIEDTTISSILGNSTFNLLNTTAYDDRDNCSLCIAIQIRGRFLGRTKLHVKLYAADPTHKQNEESQLFAENAIPIAVVRPERAVDKLFIGIVMLIMMCANLGMGCKIDLNIVKEVLRKPFPPIIGFCCQYLIMPLLGMGIVKTFGLTGGLALGFFATSCSPAGGSSNMFSFLLGGDVSLSVTMTLISVTASLAMIPLWILGVARFVLGETSVHIPFQNIIYTLASILVPVAIGILIQMKRPKWAKSITRILRPCFIIMLLVVFTFGVWTNLYIFKVIRPILLLAACLLPYTGFILSGLVAFIARQPFYRVLTIAIEAGIQNTGIPILIMKFSLPQPDADLAAVSPVAIACLTPIPLWIAVAVVEIRKRCCTKPETADKDKESHIEPLTGQLEEMGRATEAGTEKAEVEEAGEVSPDVNTVV